MRLPKEARQNVKSLEEGVLGGDLAQVTDLSAEPLALLGPFGQQLFKVPQRGQRLESGRPSSSAQIGGGIQAPGHRFPTPVRRPGTDLGFRFFGDFGLDGFGFARLNHNHIRGPANAGGLHGRAEEACRHSAQYTPRLAAHESRSWSQAGASVQ